MNLDSIAILLVEDNHADVDLIQETLADVTNPRYEWTHVGRLAQALERLTDNHFDVVLLDLTLSDGQGLESLSPMLRQAPDVPIIVLTGTDNEALAIKALQMGAQDYLVKRWADEALLIRAIRYAIERKRAEDALRKSEARFRRIIERNADSIFVVDQQGIVRFVNAAAEALFGYRAEELVGELFGFPIVIDESTELNIIPKDGKIAVVEMRVVEITWQDEIAYLASLRDITERKWVELKRRRLILELEEVLAEVKTLSGLLPICASCKKIRDDQGYWQQVEAYIEAHSEAEFSHGFCPDCLERLYPDLHAKSLERRQEILEALTKLGRANLETIAAIVGLPESNTLGRLQNMASDGEVKRLKVNEQILYELP